MSLQFFGPLIRSGNLANGLFFARRELAKLANQDDPRPAIGLMIRFCHIGICLVDPLVQLV